MWLFTILNIVVAVFIVNTIKLYHEAINKVNLIYLSKSSSNHDYVIFTPLRRQLIASDTPVASFTLG